MVAQCAQPVVSEVTRCGLGYAGDLTPRQAWELLAKNPDAVLVDVRTPAEWMFVGEPDLSSLNKNPIRLSWRLFPSFVVNPEFITSFERENIAKESPVLFLCRSGGRSLDAALAISALGYAHCYNIEDGFEGEPDAEGHRGTASGWKQNGLPWGQK